MWGGNVYLYNTKQTVLLKRRGNTYDRVTMNSSVTSTIDDIGYTDDPISDFLPTFDKHTQQYCDFYSYL